MEVFMIKILDIASWTESYSTVSEKFLVGFTMALIGIVIVLLVLTLVSLFVKGMSLLLYRDRKAESVESPSHSEPNKIRQESRIQAPVPSADRPKADHDQLIAVITAAIAAVSAEKKPSPAAEFIIRRVRRV
jgi:sodium pump decarboxylase gamma subunit